jgi:hypothetical protein
VKICETIDKNQQYKKNRKQTKTTQPEITYLADVFKLKPPCRAEGFGVGMAAEKKHHQHPTPGTASSKTEP